MSEVTKQNFSTVLNGLILAAVCWFGSNVADSNVKIARIETDLQYLKQELPKSTVNRAEIALLKERVALLEAKTDG